MVVTRKKKTIDGMDREILRRLARAQRALTSRQIAKQVELSGSAIMPRLNNLKSQGILKSQSQGIRTIKRVFNDKPKRIKAPRSIKWEIDIAKELNKERRKFLYD